MNEFEREMLELYRKSLGEKQEFHGIVCPTVLKRECRLCELCKEVLFKKLPKDDPLRKRASSLNAKQHYFSNTLFLADPTQVVVFEYGDKIFKQLLTMQMKEEQGFKDFFHPIVGRWLIIERIKGASQEQVDYYVKPKDPSKLSDMTVLGRMYDLSQIIDLIKNNKVKSIYQSKLEQTSIIRILPSWLGPDFAMKFYQKVDYHYNISEDDFKACQAGEVNPVRIGGETVKSEIFSSVPISQLKQDSQSAPISQPPASWEDLWRVKTAPTLPHPTTPITTPAVKSEIQQPVGDDELPPCYGDYDPSAPDCNTSNYPDWSDGCKAYREEKLAKRRTARRLIR